MLAGLKIALLFLKSLFIKALPYLIKFWREIIIVCLCLYAYGKNASLQALTSEFDLFKTTTAELGEKQQKENAKKVAKQKEITKSVAKDYKEAIKQLEAYYEANPNTRYITLNRLQGNDTSCSGMPAERESAEGIDAGLNGTPQASTTIDSLKAGQEVKQCLHLIEFTKKQDAIQ